MWKRDALNKTEDFLFGGYKGEIIATEDGFITGFRVLPGNVNEGKDISPLIEEEKERGIKPREVVGDGIYSSFKNFKYLALEKISGTCFCSCDYPRDKRYKVARVKQNDNSFSNCIYITKFRVFSKIRII